MRLVVPQLPILLHASDPRSALRRTTSAAAIAAMIQKTTSSALHKHDSQPHASNLATPGGLVPDIQ
jgi:hypothetical protein